ncbi:hypothetical protein EST92_29310 [Streptomyces sp. TM32]|uniref:hypothetical protein n=1 Tax=Streptomyces sp. TM32 TaxID=1652669 RepID=UPI0010127452|nr:hypothetical protein [Streptomyces sp. TM32]RXS65925.1 hypothetical protein EST92_29310 [Streptomyces sp. TM32]
MNDAEEAAQTNEGAAQVQVAVTDCPPEDARTVFRALNAVFRSDRTSDDGPADSAGSGVTVWAATVDVSTPPAETAPRRLTAPVTATLQGGYWAVDRLRAGLASVFAIQEVGSTSGDQEQEAQLRLVTRPTAA